MNGFDRDTAVRRRAASTYDVDLGAGWQSADGICGGMLVATLGRALGREFDGSDPFAISAQFPAPAGPGPATVHVEVLRRSRGLCTGSASLVQHDVERVRALAAFGDLDSLDNLDNRAGADCPDLLPPDSCPGATPAYGRLDLRLDPRPCDGRVRGWLRLSDGRPPDPLTLLLAADSLPTKQGTVTDLTAYVHARPAPGWLRLSRVTTPDSSDAEVWDSKDRLVAQARRLVSTVDAV
jgi:hypothetical protein